jgi:hypothetical protein
VHHALCVVHCTLHIVYSVLCTVLWCCVVLNSNLEKTKFHWCRQGVIVYPKSLKWCWKMMAGMKKSIAELQTMVDQNAYHEDCVEFANEIVTYKNGIM